MPALPKCAVTAVVYKADGTIDFAASIRARLSHPDRDGGFVEPTDVEATPNATTGVITLNLWPNERGATASWYDITIVGSERTERTTAVVPALTTVALESIAELGTYPGKTEGQLAIEEGIAASGTAQTAANTATTQAGIATTQAGISTTKAGEAAGSAGAAAGSAGNALTAANSASALRDETLGFRNATSAIASFVSDTWTSIQGAVSTVAGYVTAALGYRNEASTFAGNASASAGAAAGSAGTATSQAAIATGASGTATTQAGIATGAAGTATTQAGIATTKAAEAVVSAAGANGVLGTMQAAYNGLAGVTAALAIGLGYAGTAAAQVSLAQAYAAQAASVVQQDLSGAVNSKLSVAPAAPVHLFQWNTADDSLPSWPDKLADKGFLNEAVNGIYCGSQATDVYARLYGCTLGSEMLGEGKGTFATSISGWTPFNAGATTLSRSGSALRITVSSGNGDSSTNVTTVVGQLYKLTATCSARSGSTMVMYAGAGLGSNGYGYGLFPNNGGGGIGLAVNGTVELYFLATSTTTYIGAAAVGAAGSWTEYSGFSLKPVTSIPAGGNAGGFYQNGADGKFYRLYKNLFGFSNDLNNTTGWLKYNGSGGITVTSVTDPFGGTAAFRLTPGNGLIDRYINSTGAATVLGAQHTISFIAKAAGFDYLFVGGDAIQSSINAQATFNLANGTIANNAAGSATIQAVTGAAGWYFCTLTGVGTILNASASSYFMPRVTATVNATGDGVKGVDILQPQCEVGSVATAYEEKAFFGGKLETFVGNKAKPPRQGMGVVEPNRIILFDALEPGRPMWRVIKTDNTSVWNSQIFAFASFTCAEMREGVLTVGTSANRAFTMNFAREEAYGLNSLAGFGGVDPISFAKRNTAGHQLNTVVPLTGINSTAINAVAMCTMPDAPVDPATGLQVPTIAVAGDTGVSLVQNNGTVLNYAGGNSNTVFLSPNILMAGLAASINFNYILRPGQQTSLTGMVVGTSATNPNYARTGLAGSRITAIDRNLMVRSYTTAGAGLSLLRMNENALDASLEATITDTSNTGWMVGNTVRAFSDVSAGAVGSELVPDPSFNTPAAWTTDADWAVAGGKATYTNPGSGTVKSIRAVTPIPVVKDEWYTFSFTVSGLASGSAQLALFVDGASAPALSNANSPTLSAGLTIPGGYMVFSANGAYTVTFKAFNTGANLYLWAPGGTSSSYSLDDISFKQQAIVDRSYKAGRIAINGVILKTAVAAAAQLVAYGNFSAANYLRETAYSADLDPGTGGFRIATWVSASMQGNGTELITQSNDRDFTGATVGWLTYGGTGTNWGSSGGKMVANDDCYYPITGQTPGAKVRVTATVASGAMYVYNTADCTGTLLASITKNNPWQDVTVPASGELGLYCNAGTTLDDVSARLNTAGVILERSFSSGAYYKLYIDIAGKLVGEVFDGTTTRTVTQAISGGYETIIGKGFMGVVLDYATSGTLTLRLSGYPIASTTGNPLLTLNNASAVLTIGQNYALTAPFSGLIALPRIGLTACTQDAEQFIHAQERQMFRDGAQVTLPDSGAITGVKLDERLAALVTATAANESSFTGMVRTSTAAASYGNLSHINSNGGLRMIARASVIVGVDVTQPAMNLKEELERSRGELAARYKIAGIPPKDWMGAFTANTANGSAIITVTGSSLVIPDPCTLVGATVTGTGIPANTTVLFVSGTSVHLSAACTALGSGVTVSIKDLIGPVGYDAHFVSTAGAGVREGTTWTRGFDGFRPKVSFGTAPGNQWLQVEWRKQA